MQYINMLNNANDINGYKWINFKVYPVTTLVTATLVVPCRIFPERRNPTGFRQGKSKKENNQKLNSLMKPNQIKEINQFISSALKQWQDVMLTADADEWAYNLEYTTSDLFNALYIFNHVAQNIGVKNKTLDMSNVEDAGEKLREVVKTLTGHDPRVIACENKSIN